MIIIIIIHRYHQQRHHNHHSYLIITSVITNGNTIDTIDISKLETLHLYYCNAGFPFFLHY